MQKCIGVFTIISYSINTRQKLLEICDLKLFHSDSTEERVRHTSLE